MKKLLIVLFLVCCVGTIAFGQYQAVIRQLTGKVEIKTTQEDWAPARSGVAISLGTTISTGFNSRAVLDLGGSVLRVDPLTRLRIDELIEREGTVSSELFLRVGKVNTEVKSTSGIVQNFKLRSPVSTAAVRGTQFTYSGYDLFVYDGEVTYENLTGQDRTYTEGEGGGSSGDDTPSDGRVFKEAESTISSYAAGPGGQSTGGVTGTSDLGSTGSVTIVVPYVE